ncbi:MAG: hypothetical protein WC441_04885 [Patescibacteria group bacterium]
MANSKFQPNCGIPIDFEGFLGARWPKDVFYFSDDFIGNNSTASAELGTWLSTLVAQAATGVSVVDGTSGSQDETGGILAITTEATAGDGENLQVNGAAFQIKAGYPLYFETRINLKDVSNSKAFIGLCIPDTAILASAVDDIGFRIASDIWYFLTEHASTEKTTDIGITEADDDWIRLAFFYDGADTVIASVDANDKGEFTEICSRKLSVATDYVPDLIMMTPSIEFTSDATASAEIMWVDYVFCIQQRYHE